MRRIGSATRDVDSKRLPSGGAFSGSDNKRLAPSSRTSLRGVASAYAAKPRKVRPEIKKVTNRGLPGPKTKAKALGQLTVAQFEEAWGQLGGAPEQCLAPTVTVLTMLSADGRINPNKFLQILGQVDVEQKVSAVAATMPEGNPLEQHERTQMLLGAQMLSAISADRKAFGKVMIGLESVFKAMDTDGNGQIDMVEFWDGIKRFDLGITPIQWADLLRAFDDDISNGIDYTEFEAFLLKSKVMMDRQKVSQKVSKAFRAAQDMVDSFGPSENPGPGQAAENIQLCRATFEQAHANGLMARKAAVVVPSTPLSSSASSPPSARSKSAAPGLGRSKQSSNRASPDLLGYSADADADADADTDTDVNGRPFERGASAPASSSVYIGTGYRPPSSLTRQRQSSRPARTDPGFQTEFVQVQRIAGVVQGPFEDPSLRPKLKRGPSGKPVPLPNVPLDVSAKTIRQANSLYSTAPFNLLTAGSASAYANSYDPNTWLDEDNTRPTIRVTTPSRNRGRGARLAAVRGGVGGSDPRPKTAHFRGRKHSLSKQGDANSDATSAVASNDNDDSSSSSDEDVGAEAGSSTADQSDPYKDGVLFTSEEAAEAATAAVAAANASPKKKAPKKMKESNAAKDDDNAAAATAAAAAVVPKPAATASPSRPKTAVGGKKKKASGKNLSATERLEASKKKAAKAKAKAEKKLAEEKALKELAKKPKKKAGLADEAPIAKFLRLAKSKFDEFDSDSNGKISGDELEKLGEWVWSSFHPGGTPLTESEKKAMGEKILIRTDANSDMAMDFAEFGSYFEATTRAIAAFRSAKGFTTTAEDVQQEEPGTLATATNSVAAATPAASTDDATKDNAAEDTLGDKGSKEAKASDADADANEEKASSEAEDRDDKENGTKSDSDASSSAEDEKQAAAAEDASATKDGSAAAAAVESKKHEGPNPDSAVVCKNADDEDAALLEFTTLKDATAYFNCKVSDLVAAKQKSSDVNSGDSVWWSIVVLKEPEGGFKADAGGNSDSDGADADADAGLPAQDADVVVSLVDTDDISKSKDFSTLESACEYLGCTLSNLAEAYKAQSEVSPDGEEWWEVSKLVTGDTLADKLVASPKDVAVVLPAEPKNQVFMVGADDAALHKDFASVVAACVYLGCTADDLEGAWLASSQVSGDDDVWWEIKAIEYAVVMVNTESATKKKQYFDTVERTCDWLGCTVEDLVGAFKNGAEVSHGKNDDDWFIIESMFGKVRADVSGTSSSATTPDKSGPEPGDGDDHSSKKKRESLPKAVIMQDSSDSTNMREFVTIDEAVSYFGCNKDDLEQAFSAGAEVTNDDSTWYTIVHLAGSSSARTETLTTAVGDEQHEAIAVELVGADDSSLTKSFATLESACEFLGCSPVDLAEAFKSHSQVSAGDDIWYDVAKMGVPAEIASTQSPGGSSATSGGGNGSDGAGAGGSSDGGSPTSSAGSAAASDFSPPQPNPAEAAVIVKNADDPSHRRNFKSIDHASRWFGCTKADLEQAYATNVEITNGDDVWWMISKFADSADGAGDDDAARATPAPKVVLIGADDASLRKTFATFVEAYAFLGCDEAEFKHAKGKGMQVTDDGETWYTIVFDDDATPADGTSVATGADEDAVAAAVDTVDAGAHAGVVTDVAPTNEEAVAKVAELPAAGTTGTTAAIVASAAEEAGNTAEPTAVIPEEDALKKKESDSNASIKKFPPPEYPVKKDTFEGLKDTQEIEEESDKAAQPRKSAAAGDSADEAPTRGAAADVKEGEPEDAAAAAEPAAASKAEEAEKAPADAKADAEPTATDEAAQSTIAEDGDATPAANTGAGAGADVAAGAPAPVDNTEGAAPPASDAKLAVQEAADAVVPSSVPAAEAAAPAAEEAAAAAPAAEVDSAPEKEGVATAAAANVAAGGSAEPETEATEATEAEVAAAP